MLVKVGLGLHAPKYGQHHINSRMRKYTQDQMHRYKKRDLYSSRESQHQAEATNIDATVKNDSKHDIPMRGIVSDWGGIAVSDNQQEHSQRE